MFRIVSFIGLLLFSLTAVSHSYSIDLTEKQADALGQLIWKNEGQQKLQHLTSWNRDEDFPSLGLGHFIWYPTEQKGPFKEQFPELLAFFEKNGVTLPQWLAETKLAPWKSREQFYQEFDQQQLSSLRTFLSQHIELQVKFIILRLEAAIPHIIHSSTTAQKKIVKEHIKRMTATPEGVFSMLDYVNFKGEGLSKKERYQGHGWGLKQVLLNMPVEYDNALYAFGMSADEVLTRRVKNAPKKEFRWLKGWRARVYGYQKIVVQ
ncbi:hypothetical protein [Psychromonas aquimarina]|uniref:hypothetical protein n=1 Tax=Psychromonas aquimarina TaxID=444919 RepID=UPI00041374B8|nr:hypothetical protein [Psychromonas aquimarina]